MDNYKALYPIGIVAELLHIHPRTLRIYEREGLIKPARRSGKRYYSNNDVQWLKCLRKLIHEDGLNIAGIKKLLTLASCWEIRRCSEEERKNCPAVLDFPVPCWELKPKACAKKGMECPECEVFLTKKQQLMKHNCGEEPLLETT
ncbi:MAG: MerR family transcriptional regulator [Deltaproteobacteria bacterium]|nr:MerR family transcriptional regulator [Deltaproteobacteria bacterium]MBW2070970.1 MerR family transcriptional regulator [Deltaproteobacteria bacterium]